MSWKFGALLAVNAYIIACSTCNLVYASPIERRLIEYRLKAFSGIPKSADLEEYVREWQQKLKLSYPDESAERVRAKFIFSKPLSNSELVRFAGTYGLEILEAEFSTFDPQREKIYGSGYYNLSARYGENLQARLAYFEELHLKRLAKRDSKIRNLEEENYLRGNGFAYFSVVAYANAGAIVGAVDAAEVRFIPFSNHVSEAEYIKYLEIQDNLNRDSAGR
ncbi:hypothetical protein [Gloeobacter morelensis]|uniref:Uncharacterized protein n=1 Tax=Gloeobacter morelensis MG652769 TaxID=2781736 RepID=A0ABY3PGP7_9CYAN|nr:hypothetical protein [Gloeobacter morelensis]UFP92796.1 hypothetical protein ISF26_13255 [Gloeobacter morelensis MG652769]